MFVPIFFLICGVALFVYMWYRDSRATLIFTPFFVFSINDITRNWIAGFVAPLMHQTPDFYVFYLFVGSYAVFAFMFLLTNAVSGYTSSLPFEYRSRPLLGGNDRVFLITAIVGISGVAAISLFHFGGVPVAALTALDFLRGTADERAAAALGVAREVLQKGHLFGGEYTGQGIFTAVIRNGWMMLVAITYLRWRAVNNLTWKLIFAATFVMAILFIGGAGTRGYVLWMLIFFLVVVSLVRTLPLSWAFGGVAAMVLLAIGLSVISPKLNWAMKRDDFWIIAITALADRAFLANGNNTVAIVDLVRDGSWSLRLGDAHIKKVKAALPGVPSGMPVAYELYKAKNPRGRGTTFSSATYISEAYLDFGAAGALTAYAIAGIVVSLLQQLLFRVRKGTFALPIMAFAVLTVGRFPLVGPIAIFSTLFVASAFCMGMWMLYNAVLAFGTSRQTVTPHIEAGTA